MQEIVIVLALMSGLSSNSFAEREKASHALERSPFLWHYAWQLEKCRDPEIAHRAKLVAEKHITRFEYEMHLTHYAMYRGAIPPGCPRDAKLDAILDAIGKVEKQLERLEGKKP